MTASFRENARRDSPFSERELEWILESNDEAEAKANLEGRSLRRSPEGAPDEVAQVLFWLGIPFVGLGLYAFYETRSAIAYGPLVLGAVFVLVALVRRLAAKKTRAIPPKITILIFEPIFETRTVTDRNDDPSTTTYVRPKDGSFEERVWPSRLAARAKTLAEGERIRVAILRYESGEFIAWAHPV